jgi:hypothetical protein
VARPTKLTPTRHERIVQILRVGNHRDAACHAAGIAPSTFYAWLKRGEHDDDGIYRQFLEAVTRAEAEAEVYAVAVIRRAMPDDWRAAIAFLERRYPSRWHRQTTTELTGKDGGPIRTKVEQLPLDLSDLSDEELRVLEKLNARTNDRRD